MGVVVRSPANKKIDRADCKCFLLARHKNEEGNFLCFREGVVGALTNDQEKKLCTERSFLTEEKGGLAKDSKSEEVRNILRTVERFSKGVHAAVKVYDDSGQKDIPFWRNVVRNEVNKLPVTAQEAPQTAPKTEKKTPKTPRERKPVASGRTAPPIPDNVPIEGRNIRKPEDVERELQEKLAKYTRQADVDDRERMLSKVELRNYRYAPDIERTYFPFGRD